MKKGFRISLRAGERVYINGAVLRPDRKVALEFLNDVAFLLENHVILAEETTTPLRQLYFVAQTMLMDPQSAAQSKCLFEQSYALLLSSFTNEEVLAGLRSIHELVASDRVYDALKAIRALFPLEEAILNEGRSNDSPNREVA